MKPASPSILKSESTNQKILRASLIIGSLAIVAKVAASIKEVFVAQAFGSGDVVDSFLIAFLLPSFVVAFSVGALVSSFVPVLAEAKHKEGLVAAQELLSNMVALSVIVLIAVALLMGLFAPFYLRLLGHGFSFSKLLLTRELLYA